MQRALAWLLAGGMLLAAVWIVEESGRPRVAGGAADPTAETAAAPEVVTGTRELGPSHPVGLQPADPAGPAAADDGARAPDAQTARATGGGPGTAAGVGGERRTAGGGERRARGEAGDAPGVAGRAAAEEPLDDGTDEPVVDPIQPWTEADLARWAEQNQLLSELEFRARVDREARRGTPEPEQKVWSDTALAWYLAWTRLGPDPAPNGFRPLMDAAPTLIAGMTPAERASLMERAMAALQDVDPTSVMAASSGRVP